MNQSKISVRYAKALFMAALEAKNLKKVMEDVDFFMKVHKEGRFREMLESPVVKPSDKKKVVNELFSKRISRLSLDFFNLLLANKREVYIPDIARNFKALYKRNMGIRNAELTVSKKVDKEFIVKFKEILKKTYNSEIELEEKVKPEIIGGFILKVEDEQYDASVSSGLAKIRKKLLETTSENKL
jgi:F-type H+-transporting ATPase subunit delta